MSDGQVVDNDLLVKESCYIFIDSQQVKFQYNFSILQLVHYMHIRTLKMGRLKM